MSNQALRRACPHLARDLPAPGEARWSTPASSSAGSPSFRRSALGHGLTAIVEVTLDRQSAEALAAFEARAVAEDAVRQCHRVSPGPDFVLIDPGRRHGGLPRAGQRLFTQDANVRNIKAFFSVHRAKFETRIALPLAR